jgi:hypothetical protein
MQAEHYDTLIEAGSNYRLELDLVDNEERPIDLTGHTFKMSIKRNVGDASSLVDCTVTVAQSTNKNDVIFTLTPAQTLALPLNPNDGINRKTTYFVYDVKWTDTDGIVRRPMEGRVAVSPVVSR